MGVEVGAGICRELEPEQEISKMGGSGNPVSKVLYITMLPKLLRLKKKKDDCPSLQNPGAGPNLLQIFNNLKLIPTNFLAFFLVVLKFFSPESGSTY